MSVTWINNFPAKSGQREKVVGFIKGGVETMKKAGCTRLEIFFDQDNDNKVLTVEEWNSKESHQNFLKYMSETGALKKTYDTLEGEPSGHYYNQVI